MALWKDPTKPTADAPQPARFDAPVQPEFKPEPVKHEPAIPMPAPVRAGVKTESLIAPDIAIEGKIEGAGHVRIAGRFKGDVDVRGDLTIEPNAKVQGSVRADKVIIAGELVGNVETATHVDLLQTGAITGDVKAGSLSVAAGSRMRGQAEFGWENIKAETKKSERNGAAA